MKNTLCLTLVLLLIALAGCEGPTGPKGKDGVDGNANVVVARSQVTPGSWSAGSSGTLYFANVSAPNITSTIVSHGSVFVYSSSDNATWGLLPSTNPSSSSGDVFVIDYVYVVGSVQLQSQRVVTNTAAYPNYTMYLKIVTIESAFEITNSMKGINWGNYNEVKQKFNLQD